MYYKLKNYNFKYIIKLHSKSDKFYRYLTNYVLSKKTDELTKLFNNYNNCVGYPRLSIYNNRVNQDLINKYQSELDKKKFLAGTIFFCKKNIFDSVLNFIKKNNHQSYFLNNFYLNNFIFYKNSPIHFLERLFGFIKVPEATI